MAIDIPVPELGESITEATVASWLVAQGETVRADQPLVELETDKATIEIAAPKAGVLSEILVAEGEDVAVGAVLARLEEGAGTARAPSGAAPEPSPPPPVAGPAPDEAPPAELDPDAIPRSGPDSSITLADLRGAVGLEPETPASAPPGPAARKWLSDHALDADALRPSGPGGRITKGDVIAHLEREASAAPPAARGPAEPVASSARHEERTRMTRVRRTIASRLKEAQETAAILTTFNEVDMSAVKALRARHGQAFEARHGVRLGFMSFFARAVVSALEAFPVVNARIEGDEVVSPDFVDIGMAVSSPAGLVVPVVRDCQQLSFAEIERELARLAERARTGSLDNDEMRGGTFSISNGGVFGSLMSTPILNRPQSAILGLHKIQDRPVAREGEVVVRPMMYLALSYDHRLVDGREAVGFLVRVVEAVEDPERLFLDL